MRRAWISALALLASPMRSPADPRISLESQNRFVYAYAFHAYAGEDWSAQTAPDFRSFDSHVTSFVTTAGGGPIGSAQAMAAQQSSIGEHSIQAAGSVGNDVYPLSGNGRTYDVSSCLVGFRVDSTCTFRFDARISVEPAGSWPWREFSVTAFLSGPGSESNWTAHACPRLGPAAKKSWSARRAASCNRGDIRSALPPSATWNSRLALVSPTTAPTTP